MNCEDMYYIVTEADKNISHIAVGRSNYLTYLLFNTQCHCSLSALNH